MTFLRKSPPESQPTLSPITPADIPPLGVLRHLHQEYDEANATFWGFIRAEAKPCFTHGLLGDIATMGMTLRRLHAQRKAAGQTPPRYFVGGSRAPGIFNLGGDLSLFLETIRAHDHSTLRAYAYQCIDAVYGFYTAFDLPIIGISLVQGDALGGGFEAAMAADIIVAERRARFGLPEVLFNLFPGMGAYSLLSRRLDATRAKQMILSGRIYTAEEMAALGIVDVIAEDGFGEEAVRDYIARDTRRFGAHYAVCQAQRRVKPLDLAELRDITDLWVDAAMALCEDDLRRMQRLLTAQARRQKGFADGQAAAAPSGVARPGDLVAAE